MIKKLNLSGTCFSKGWVKLSLKKQREIKPLIKEVLHIGTDMQFYKYKNGVPEMKVSQALAVEKLFRQFGVKDCWGKDE